ncbi:MAG: ribose-phosphate pyrophosphokinase [Chrysothrix sp. TS-e1954]|nr:MAG: ribose-phosphate pyrophosphokinase [Chrysothrix sp. TS-e1954]
MVRNIVVFAGSSHPELTDTICNHLGVPQAKATLSKFSVGETRVEIEESVRGKDVYIVQSGGGQVNDNLMELLITISACKTASASKVTAVLPMFPYSRQSDLPYNKVGAPLSRPSTNTSLESPVTDSNKAATPSNGAGGTEKQLSRLSVQDGSNGVETTHFRPRPNGTVMSPAADARQRPYMNGTSADNNVATASHIAQTPHFEPQRGYKQWVAQAGTLVADLLTCAGTDHVITMDLHDPQYQGFFDIPVDNLYGRHLLRKYIKYSIPNYQQAVIVSPDAGGAKRATAIADGLGMPFALIHKERRPTQINDRQNASMLLVGNVEGRTAILIDDLADTSNTITRAAKLLKSKGAAQIYALITHGVLSGDAIERINASHLDKVVVTNTVDQKEHQSRCPKLEVLNVGMIFAEAIRRVHHGESISVLFEHD